MSKFATKVCKACQSSFEPKHGRQVYCGKPSCTKAAAVVTVTHTAKAEEKPEAEAGLSPFDVVDAFALDYFLGNVVRFVLEHDDGDELENLRQARTYLEEKIERLERAGAAS